MRVQSIISSQSVTLSLIFLSPTCVPSPLPFPSLSLYLSIRCPVFCLLCTVTIAISQSVTPFVYLLSSLLRVSWLMLFPNLSVFFSYSGLANMCVLTIPVSQCVTLCSSVVLSPNDAPWQSPSPTWSHYLSICPDECHLQLLPSICCPLSCVCVLTVVTSQAVTWLVSCTAVRRPLQRLCPSVSLSICLKE